MGYFSSGDILELGCYGGLSTSILSRANRDSGMKKQVYTDDLDGAVVDVAKNNLTKLNLDENVIFHVNDATKLILSFISNNKKFGFVFIDHSHEYQPVYNVCKNLDKLMVPGSFCLFHDYNDSRNLDMNDKDYGVYQAVNDGLDERTFEFYGIFGCTVLFRKRLK